MALDPLKNYLIGVIIFIIVCTGGVVILGDFYAVDTTLDSRGELTQFRNAMNKSSEVTASVNQINESINKGSSSGSLGWYDALFGTTYEGLKSLGNSIGFMNLAFTQAGALFYIPGWIVALLLLIIIIIVGFAIWAAIVRA